jgi:hypothetical protein
VSAAAVPTAQGMADAAESLYTASQAVAFGHSSRGRSAGEADDGDPDIALKCRQIPARAGVWGRELAGGVHMHEAPGQ